MTTVALLLVLQMPSHVEAPPDVGEVRRDFRGTKWVVVSGQHATAKVSHATLFFKYENEVEICVDFDCGGMKIGNHQSRTYRHDPGSQLPVIAPRTWLGTPFTEEATLQDQGSRLLLDLDLCHPFQKAWEPRGKVLLLLKLAPIRENGGIR